MLQYTTLSNKAYHCTLSELKIHVFTLSNLMTCLSIPCPEQKQHSNPDFSFYSDNYTLRICVNTTNDQLHVKNIRAGVTNHLFCSLH